MKLFRKINSTAFPDALIKEAQGLNWLRAAAPELLSVPVVEAVDETSMTMTLIDTCNGSARQWRQLGQGLALLHATQQPSYGFASHNYIGLNPQQNVLADNWGEFFLKHRLQYQIELIADLSLRKSTLARLDQSANRIVDFLNTTTDFPSLLHGDLWSGNVLFDRNDQVWLIDPAVYFGDREVDLAMSELFGGFDREFYRSYNGILPISEHYPIKKNIYNLYHCCNHFNLFGAGYWPLCVSALSKIEALT